MPDHAIPVSNFIALPTHCRCPLCVTWQLNDTLAGRHKAPCCRCIWITGRHLRCTVGCTALNVSSALRALRISTSQMCADTLNLPGPSCCAASPCTILRSPGVLLLLLFPYCASPQHAAQLEPPPRWDQPKPVPRRRPRTWGHTRCTPTPTPADGQPHPFCRRGDLHAQAGQGMVPVQVQGQRAQHGQVPSPSICCYHS